MISALCHFLQDMMRKSWKMRENRILHASYQSLDQDLPLLEDRKRLSLLVKQEKQICFFIISEVQWAFQGIKTPMGVATYDNIRLQEIKSQLPSEEAIQKRIEQAEEEYILKQKEKKK